MHQLASWNRLCAWALGTAVACLGLSASAGQQVLLRPATTQPVEATAQLGRTCRSFFRVLPYLTHVTTTAIRVNMIPEDSFDLRLSLSLASADTYGVIAQVIQTGATADVRTHLVAAPTATFTGLIAGTQYKYLAECRASATAHWEPIQRAYFKTLQTNAAAVVRAAVVSDSHTFQFWNQRQCGLQVTALPNMQVTISNILGRVPDYLVDLGDTENTDFSGAVCAAVYTRENGSTHTFTQSGADTATEANARFEVYLSIWQPLFAFVPFFPTPGNHEQISGWGGVGAAELCEYSTDNTLMALTAYQANLGNFNDAFPNGSTADLDGDTVVENQEDGLYYEFASGSLRWFMTENMRYSADARAAGATPAGAFPGFVARTADTPAATFGSVPSGSWPNNGTDTYEDNITMGGTETAWFVTQATAKTEAFGTIASHRVVGGYPAQPNNCYYYQRGGIATGDSDADGKIEVTDTWDADRDGDRSDEHYVQALMAAEALQIRFHGHDHVHVICRKGGVNYIEVGVPSCPNNLPCSLPWENTPSILADFQLIDSYDCDEDGFGDYDPNGTDTILLSNVQNGGITGANGTKNPGFGLLTVNGATNMQWQWIVTDEINAGRNNTPVITYGPIVP